jgi:hypothetical protein
MSHVDLLGRAPQTEEAVLDQDVEAEARLIHFRNTNEATVSKRTLWIQGKYGYRKRMNQCTCRASKSLKILFFVKSEMRILWVVLRLKRDHDRMPLLSVMVLRLQCASELLGELWRCPPPRLHASEVGLQNLPYYKV